MLATTLLAASLLPAVWGVSIDELFQEKESRVLALAARVSSEYEARCSSYSGCSSSSYDNCVSAYPAQTCPADGMKVPACAGCGDNSADAGAAFFDYTVSAARLPESQSQGVSGNNQPASDEAAETICYTRNLDDFFITEYAKDVASGTYGDKTPQMYFGASTGAFRIFPARHAGDCGAYDPRVRPWYVASSSGPKDVVLVLDVSGSMTESGRAVLMVDAAQAVIKTLTIADWFSVVLFSSSASTLSNMGVYLQQATKETKDAAIAALESVQIGGGTNFRQGFAKAFEVFKASVDMEYTAGCHKAILFLTDGANTDGTPAEVLSDVTTGNAPYGATVFTYSLGAGADSALPKSIACQNSGVWAPIADGADLVGSMSSYFQLFARGLGDQENEGFTAWVEPYAFATGGGMGTTVGAPVYDRTLTPPHFIGVAAIDMAVDFLEEQSGSVYQELLDSLVLRSKARCPTLRLEKCVLQALRLSTGGMGSVCSAADLGGDDCMTSDSTVERRNGSTYDPPTCMNAAPRDVWANHDLQGSSYEDRACCVPGEPEASAGCSASAEACDGRCIGGIVGGVAGIFVLIVLGKMMMTMKMPARVTQQSAASQQTAAPPVCPPVVAGTPPVAMGLPVE